MANEIVTARKGPVLEITLNRLLAANNAVTGTLTFAGARADGDKPVSYFIPNKELLPPQK
jgi:hypothetical protein